MKPLLFIILNAICAITSWAQKPKSPLSFSSNNSIAYFSGNVKKLDVLTNNEFSYKDSLREFVMGYHFMYGEQDNAKYLLEHFANAQYDHHPYQRVSPWVNASVLSNVYKGFDMRLNTAGGAKYRFVYTKKHDWSLSAGLLFDHTNFTEPTEANVLPRASENVLRLSIRPKIKINFDENTQLKHITFYQPEIANFNNYIAWSQTEFSVRVYKFVNLSLLYYYYYNNRPAYETIFKTDQRIMFGVKVEV